MAPQSQKPDARPISFYLDPGDSGVGGSPIHLPLAIRPEDLSRYEPSLMTPQMTFGGGWIDDFGPALSSIQISGHTGWGSGGRPDGISAWLSLRDTVFSSWHSWRDQAVANGRNPDSIKLVFADKLDEIVATVAPGQIVLKRNKNRPLLMMYQISMTVLSDSIQDPTSDPINLSPGRDGVMAGMDSLNASLNALTGAAANLRSFVQSGVIAPIGSFMNAANAVLGKVMSVMNTSRGVIDAQAAQLIGLAADVATVGRNVFYTYNAVASLPDASGQAVAAVAAAFHNAACVLRNAFTAAMQYPDYSSVYGATVCSSTIGGSPISSLTGLNTFDTIMPVSSPLVSVTQEARGHIDVLKAADPVLNPMTLSDVASRANAVAAGVSVLA